MNILIKIFVTACALLLAAYMVPGIEVANIYSAIIAAIVLGVLNLIVRPILIVLTLPLTIITFGLFIFIINTLLFLFAASFIDGFTVEGFIPALVGSIVVSVVSTIGNKILT